MDARIKAVSFDEENHRYFYDGRELHGITGVIGKLMGKDFPDIDVVKLSTIYGHDVHKESEEWIKEGKNPSTEAGAWLVNELMEFGRQHNVREYEAELLVSDFEGTASAVDIVAHTPEGAWLFDIKTTSYFDRPYCSWQLSVYKRLYEACYEDKVLGLAVFSTSARRMFKIFEQEKHKVDLVLEKNRRL